MGTQADLAAEEKEDEARGASLVDYSQDVATQTEPEPPTGINQCKKPFTLEHKIYHNLLDQEKRKYHQRKIEQLQAENDRLRSWIMPLSKQVINALKGIPSQLCRNWEMLLLVKEYTDYKKKNEM